MNTLRRFFAEFEADDRQITLEGDETFHLKTVIRNRTGDVIEVFNGRGNLAIGEIMEAGENRAKVRVKEMTGQKKPEPRVVVAPSLLKKKAMNDLVEKLTEIGVDEIRPVLFKRTDTPYPASALVKWNRIAIQALKVNRRFWKPDIFPPVAIEQILALGKKFGTAILLDLDGKSDPDFPILPPVLAVIGPPGDFTTEERRMFIENGFKGLRLNDGTLRTETAAISIGAILKMKTGTGKTA